MNPRHAIDVNLSFCLRFDVLAACTEALTDRPLLLAGVDPAECALAAFSRRGFRYDVYEAGQLDGALRQVELIDSFNISGARLHRERSDTGQRPSARPRVSLGGAPACPGLLLGWFAGIIERWIRAASFCARSVGSRVQSFVDAPIRAQMLLAWRCHRCVSVSSRVRSSHVSCQSHQMAPVPHFLRI